MNLKLRSDKLIRFLVPASLIYLALPYLIFFFGWLKFYYAALCVGVLVVSLYACLRRLGQERQAEADRPDALAIPRYFIPMLMLVAALFLSISGIGGVGYQDSDWIKHNAILKDLIDHPWPVYYQIDDQALPLVYYIAYYLPSALLGKLGGWELANLSLYVWSVIGLTLALSWFLLLSRRFAWLLVLLFILFSGLDVVGELLVRWLVVPLRPEALTVLSWEHIEQWAIGWQYSANTTLLFWVPHQALAGWIAAGMLLFAIFSGQDRLAAGAGLLLLGLTALWSPFVTLGLVPFLLAALLFKPEGGPEDGWMRSHLKRALTLPNLGGLVMGGIIALYYAAKFFSPLGSGKVPHGFGLPATLDDQARLIGLGLMVVFCLLEFGLYSLLLIGPVRKSGPKARIIFTVMLACLALFPFYRVGGVNDFVMRASIPALFILAAFLGRSLAGRSLVGVTRVAIIVLLVIGAITPLVEINRHVNGIVEAGALVQIPDEDEVLSVEEWAVRTDKDLAILWQYLGDRQSAFFEYLAKE